MNVGIYVRTLAERSPASARFQETILEGLHELKAPNLRFVVLADSIPPGYEDAEHVTYVALRTPSRAQGVTRKAKLLIGGIARRILRICGRASGASYGLVTRWLAYEPPYVEQLRQLDIRLIWNLGVDVLPAPMPYAMVVWDCNYRIHPMFPEYSYVTEGYKFFDRTTPLLQGASYVIVGTEQGKREVVEIFGVYANKVRVIPFPTPSLPATVEPIGEVPSPYLFYPARLWPHKNHVVLVHALKILRDRHDLTVRCVLSGIDNGNLGYVLELAELLGVRSQIEYLGNVSVEQLANLYRNAAALTYCSAVGPDNFPPLEAMSVGCPVITADVEGAREQYGDAALFFAPTNEEELAKRIWELLHDPALRERLVARGFSRAAEWSPKDYARSMAEVLGDFALTARMWAGADFNARLV